MTARTTRIIRLALVVVISTIIASLSFGQTNSYISSTDGFWDEARLWSLAEPPSVLQSGILITNAVDVTVTIDSLTANSFLSTLTISNLTVLPPFGSTNTLYLDNTGTTALHVLNEFRIAFNPDAPVQGAAAVISSNSTLIVDGLLGGALEDDGTLIFIGGSLIMTNSSLDIGISLFESGASGVLIVSNAVVQAAAVTVAKYDTSTGYLEVIGGTMSASSLTVGDSEDGGGATMLLENGAQLVVTNGQTDIGGLNQSSGTLMVSDASFFAQGVSLGGESSSGTLVIDNGTVTLSGKLGIGFGDESDGEVSLNGGMLVVTNGTTTVGGDPGIGRFTISGGVFLGQSLVYAEGQFGIGGGTSILNSSLTIFGFSTASLGGGQLFVTNGPIAIAEHSEYDVSGGLLAAQTIELGINDIGTLSVSGGSVTVSTGITMGTCDNSFIIGYGLVTGGQLIVTNASHSAYIDAQNGQLTLSSGTLQVDQLVMTNTCSEFIHTGGTLIVGNVILDPNAFRIVSVTPQSNDVLISWLMAPGATNALQASTGTSNGSYNTNTFSDIFIVTNNTATGVLTNFLDLGAATNQSRYYRARLSL